MLVFLAGCSVFMAASGKEDPNVMVMQPGTPRYIVESQLGPPASMRTEPNGECWCTYVYEVGNQPSGGRAAMHAVLDVLSIGIWEVVGTPMEAVQGSQQMATVVYTPDNVVKTLWVSPYAAPPAASSSQTQGSDYPN
jgi:hypothetical protein